MVEKEGWRKSYKKKKWQRKEKEARQTSEAAILEDDEIPCTMEVEVQIFPPIL